MIRLSRKILLVDDELLTIQAIQMNIDWEKCDIDEVFLCDNVNDARTVLEVHPVSVREPQFHLAWRNIF